MVVNPKSKSKINNLLLEVHEWLPCCLVSTEVKKSAFWNSQLPTELGAKALLHSCQRVCYHLKALLDALAAFWVSTPQYWRHCIYSGHILTRTDYMSRGWGKKGVHKQSGQTITNPKHAPQTQDNSYSKSKSVKRLKETGTRPCSIRGTSLMKS